MKKHCHPQTIIEVVYKTKENYWRGFCVPFDVTCEAVTQEEAVRKLDESVESYLNGLKKYDFPEHLVFKKLSDAADRKIFKMIIEKIMKKYAKQFYEAQKEGKIEYKERGIISYLSQPCCFAH